MSLRDRRRAFLAAFLGWMLDGYDFTILTLVLIDIQRDFNVAHAAIGALGTATLLMRLVGGALAGAAADRWGRKLPLMVSILWFSAFAFLSGLSPGYQTLLLCRALFGLGMGGEWAAGMPLVLEHYPESRRGLVMGVLQGAFSWGFILAAGVFQLSYSALEGGAIAPWRLLMFSGLVPALLVIWIRRDVPESPLWLAGRTARAGPAMGSRSMLRLFLRPDVLAVAAILAAIMFAYQSMSFWYASLLRERALAPLQYLVALNVGGIAGAAIWGWAGDTRLGHRRALMLGAALSLASLPAFLFATSPSTLFAGALAIGLTGAGMLGIAPSFVGRRFQTSERALGWGVVYHIAVSAGALAPLAIGRLQDLGWTLPSAMAAAIGTASVVAVALLAMTRD
ncbi:MAG TPA: MFS transporter [Vicinamibacterales bacterium]|nr:MFS transporter [Vicinamibacterales bacterium]